MAEKPTKYKVTTPDGRVYTLTSYHTYTHAVIGQRADKWDVLRWSRSKQNAEKGFKTFKGIYAPEKMQIIPVEVQR